VAGFKIVPSRGKKRPPGERSASPVDERRTDTRSFRVGTLAFAAGFGVLAAVRWQL
jgi:hypothetical protein